MRELYPLPIVDETLGQLTGAAVFSKLDGNSDFSQIPPPVVLIGFSLICACIL